MPLPSPQESGEGAGHPREMTRLDLGPDWTQDTQEGTGHKENG